MTLPDPLAADLRGVAEHRCSAVLLAAANAVERGDIDKTSGDWLLAQLVDNGKAEHARLTGLFTTAADSSTHDHDFRRVDLDTVIAHGWRVYSASNGQRFWGSGAGGGRAGAYGYEALRLDPVDGLVITTDPAYVDGVRVRTPQGVPAWWAAYLRLEGVPKEFRAECEARSDVSPGWWTAPLWASHPASLIEVDWEYFPDRPGRMRAALHVGFDGDNKVTYNVSARLGPHEITVDPTEWHRYGITSRMTNTDGLVIGWLLDGHVVQEISQRMIEATYAKTMAKAVTGGYQAGTWTLDTSVNVGTTGNVGAPTNDTRGAQMMVRWIDVEHP